MRPFAYKTARYAIKALSDLTRANIRIFGEKEIPKGSVLFAVNHFTRMETLLIPYYIHRLTGQTLWALADDNLFNSGLKNFLDYLGAISTKHPDRDRLIVKSLLTGEASWVIFPEGRMVKTKKVYDADGTPKGRFLIAAPDGAHPPHSGTAALALRTQFYRERYRRMRETHPEEAARMLRMFEIEDPAPVLNHETWIVPVNLTYYPIRARENLFSRMAGRFVEDLSERMIEEIMTEGTMLLAGVDVDMRFGTPIRVAPYLKSRAVQADILSSDPINFDDIIPSISMIRKTAVKIMERYMSAIYALTTVNHDHIFASMLKFLPRGKISQQEFRQRIFLAANLCFECMDFYRHDSLMRNQIHLLTDDRFHKVRNFIELAVEKGAIRKENDYFITDPAFCDISDFHCARKDSLLGMIANEIEPLLKLQEHLRQIAREHPLRIKYQIKRDLIHKARFDFEKAYARFAVEGQSKPKAVGAPFFVRLNKGAKEKETGVVLIHGYMAAPLEVRALAEYLGSRGFRTYAPRLKGHGTAPEDLAVSGYMEWVESVEEAFVIMEGICRKVVVGGFSTGAGLALDLAARVDPLAGVFAISPPFKLQDFSARFVPAVNFWNKLMNRFNMETAKKEFVENHPENPHINYTRNPISGIIELDRLMDQIEPRLPDIKVPALIIQSLGDPVVNPAGSFKIFEHLGAKDKEYLMVNYERHGIINGERSDRIFRMVEDFLGRLKDDQSEENA